MLGELVESISETYKFKLHEQVIFLNTSDILFGKITNRLLQDSSNLPGQAKKRITKGDLLFSEIRPANGRYAVIDFNAENYVVSTKLMVLRCNAGIDKDYFRIFLTSEEQLDYLQLLAEDRSGTFPQITFDHISSLNISLPPLPEQKAIASVISSLDNKIDLLHRQNKTLEAMAETLFRQWFVEELEEDSNTIFLGDIAYFSNGKSRPEEVPNGSVPIYGGNGILGYTNQSNSNGFSIIIGRVGAYCGSLFIENKPIWISDNAMLAKPINDSSHSYLFYLLKNLRLNEFAEGSSHPLLTQTLLNSIQIISPSAEKISLFCHETDKWKEKSDFNQLQIETLKTLRDTLLPKLMSGEVRVDYP